MSQPENEKSRIDGLTGLYNHRFFQEMLNKELARAERHRLPLTMLKLDIDRMKEINDAFGHATGDKVIKRVADVLQSSLRQIDWVCRQLALMLVRSAEVGRFFEERISGKFPFSRVRVFET